MVQKNVLGRGMGALLPVVEEEKKLILCGIEELTPNRHQPRKVFESDKLRDLPASIKEKGVIQPLLARRIPGGYELIAGERRWRAAQIAWLNGDRGGVPVCRWIQLLSITFTGTIQRADLN